MHIFAKHLTYFCMHCPLITDIKINFYADSKKGVNFAQLLTSKFTLSLKYSLKLSNFSILDHHIVLKECNINYAKHCISVMKGE